MTEVVVRERHQLVVKDIGRGQMHILTHGQVEGITGLIGIHDVLIVLQADRVSLGIVEREVDVVGEVGKHIAQIVAQSLCNLQIGQRGELGFNLGGHVSDQLQVVINFSLLTAVTLVLVNHRAPYEDSHESCPRQDISYDTTQSQRYLLLN